MAESKPSFSLVGTVLERDVFNPYGLFLLPAQKMLQYEDIILLQKHRVESVSVSKPAEVSPLEKPFDSWNDREAARQYLATLDQTRDLFRKITEVYIPPLNQFQEAFFPILDKVLNRNGILQYMYLREGSTDYTYRHSINVGILAAIIGKLMNYSPEQVILLGQAGLLHDVGKMVVPYDILMKPDKLTSHEFEIMKQHTVFGADLLLKAEDSHDLFTLGALLHHERLDGSGYPEGRKWDTIPLECQILSVADVFDAICTDRVYKRGTSPFDAARVLWESACDGKLNAEIVTRLVHYIALLFVGATAVLNSGQHVKVVLIHTDEPMRPLVHMGEEYIDLRQHRSLSIERMIG
ncbi:HD-GYP domain-containing protein [Brevibacillus sp. H7]|uniref:HD-GYP domain-containing protein n=1 Tax=Brevibacillus sp. H7 TaxID=3349138 RepID=UPI00381FBA15